MRTRKHIPGKWAASDACFACHNKHFTSGRKFFEVAPRFIVLLLLCLILNNCNPAPKQEEPTRTNVIILAVDTLRHDYVSCLGDKAQTPIIDSLAREGILFTRAYSHIPITGPSFSSLFTSLYPSQHFVHNNTHILQQKFETLAEMLQKQGYTTAAVIGLNTLRGKFGFKQGFDYFNDQDLSTGRSAEEINEVAFEWLKKNQDSLFFLFLHYQDPHFPYLPKNFRKTMRIVFNEETLMDLAPEDVKPKKIKVNFKPGLNTMSLIALDREEIPVQTKRPKYRSFDIFNVVCQPDTISMEFDQGWSQSFKTWQSETRSMGAQATIQFTNNNPGEVQGFFKFQAIIRNLSVAEIKERYRLETEYLDFHIGALIARLKEYGLFDSSFLIFVSDHGEGLGDHRCIGHLDNLYESLIHIPLVMKFPQGGEGIKVNTPVSIIDVVPTIVEVIGGTISQQCRGKSLIPLIEGQEKETRLVFSETFKPEAAQNLKAMITGKQKFIYNPDTNKCEFFDLMTDSSELNNRYDQSKETFNWYKEKIKTFSIATGDSKVLKTEIDDKLLEELYTLGYLHEKK
ncbi:sulfatase [candidate division CSSED10-310 bacterium]|uniref:Sulfatase n=1 Tax=candidate division CSSED10-310 bacterium TaxID=2855610 RepID=A0ABV6YT50_UNCC1